MTKELYNYSATIVRVVDGDTCDALIDLGFKISFKIRLRMLGINTPETYGVKRTSDEYKAGLISKNWLKAKIFKKKVIIQTNKDKKGKYGRYLATIFLNGENINQEMLDRGLAKPY